ncbi:uncharacterized protein AC631_03445 [Debaryomyces fabryi]|uniref:Major facilitator superfamily (MFS) profile domain-containing protein n=1 Tax=Debaryomyces fabryi TaxID=58627 RepID=A0A0V1PXI9_9ASCO|nr:uncharacterized protein AC631_03445 [Debaryomyces fabryi]KSA00796.1 hypothetical protein AC631_03445 [Debaryomyces fabryi]CUM55113.1 unnamed protein product [Debaryomyces fabryi]
MSVSSLNIASFEQPEALESRISNIPRTRKESLGSIQLYHPETKKRIFIPEPSVHPDDPLTWTQLHKFYITLLVSYAIMLSNFLAGGPSIGIVQMAMDFGENAEGPDYDLTHWVSKVAYCFTATALLQGTSNFFWVPLMTKYGKRPVYLATALGYFVFALACGFASNWESYLAFRTLLGFFSGGNEVLGPLTISDVFYTHQRGTQMAIYTCALSLGIALGMIVSGLILINYDWRYIYYIGSALIGSCAVLIFFTLPETSFERDPKLLVSFIEAKKATEKHIDEKTSVAMVEENSSFESSIDLDVPQKTSYLSSLKIFKKRTYTEESLWQIFIRPIGLIILPGVLWASLIMSATIGFLVAVSTNVANAFQQTYNFEPWECGLCFIGAFIGSLLGIFAGGTIVDWWVDFMAKRNNGIKEPEMRLPPIILGGILTPVALVLYGVGIEKSLHWIVPTLGLSLLNFSLTQATNISLVYTIDCYRPIVGEITVTQLAFKSLFGFMLSFYTNPWVDNFGYAKAYGEMAAIAGILFVLSIPIYIWGKKMRETTHNWRILKFIKWKDDREVGE